MLFNPFGGGQSSGFLCIVGSRITTRDQYTKSSKQFSTINGFEYHFTEVRC